MPPRLKTNVRDMGRRHSDAMTQIPLSGRLSVALDPPRALDRLKTQALDAGRDGIAIVEEASGGEGWRLLYANPAWAALSGRNVPTADSQTFEWPASEDVTALQELRTALMTGQAMHRLLRLANAPGLPQWADVTIFPSLDLLETAPLRVVAMRDMTRYIDNQDALLEALQREKTALSFAELGTFEWDLSSGMIANSEISRRLFDLDAGERTVHFQRLQGRVHPSDRRGLGLAVRRNLAKKEHLDVEFRIVIPDGRTRWLHCRGDVLWSPQGPEKIFGLVQDVTQRRDAEERARHLASHDVLTGLPNRALFEDRLRQAVALAQRRGHRLAVLFIDLDNFKTINDSMGHLTGDALLRGVAQRLRAAVRQTDTASRQSGDEFVVLLNGIASADEAGIVANKILDSLSLPHPVQGAHEVVASPSIGVSVFPDDAASAEDLMRNADAAMYDAKGSGRRRVCFFTPLMQEKATQKVSILRGLRDAVDENRLELHFQPQVDGHTGRWVAVEAFVRWNHPSRGLLLPGAFLPIAENHEVMQAAGDWVLRDACARLREWLPYRDWPVAINLAPFQLRSRLLLKTVGDLLSEHGLAPADVEIELNEHALIRDSEEAMRLLHGLHEMGVRICLDDFGTGYSSLSFLKRFPIDKLKIDRSFLNGLPNDHEDQAIARAIIELGRSLDMPVVAEGVERLEQYQALQAAGCHIAQGHLLSPPVPAQELAAIIGHDLRPH